MMRLGQPSPSVAGYRPILRSRLRLRSPASDLRYSQGACFAWGIFKHPCPDCASIELHHTRARICLGELRRTKDIRAVQELLGHSSLAVTERYVQCDDDAKRAAMMAAVA